MGDNTIDPADIPTIRHMLEDYGVDDYLTPANFENLVASLEERESIMIKELGPEVYRLGLDRIISEH